jgi:hypothetical protein
MSPDNHDRVVEFRRSTGPVSSSDRWSFFDVNELPGVTIPRSDSDAGEGMKVRALINHSDENGYSLTCVRYPPNMRVPRHRHSVPQISLVLEGDVRQGNRLIPAGCGYYTPANAPYGLRVGEAGAVIVEFRHDPMTFTTEWVDGDGFAVE